MLIQSVTDNQVNSTPPMKLKLKVLVIGGISGSQVKLINVLEQIEEVEVIAHVGCGEDAINQYSQLAPDVILIDVLTDGITGLETARWIKEQTPEMKIILLSSEFNKEFLGAIMTMGLDGYIVKDINAPMLREALKSLCDS